MSKNIVLLISTVVLSIFFSACSTKQSASLQSKAQIDEIAISGYDAVSYFVSGEASKADETYSYSHNDSKWHFKSIENLEKFKSDPKRYMPQYNGYCAYEIANGNLVKSDPNFWHIYNKKLYLFSDEEASRKWFREITEMIDFSEEIWREKTRPVTIEVSSAEKVPDVEPITVSEPSEIAAIPAATETLIDSESEDIAPFVSAEAETLESSQKPEKVLPPHIPLMPTLAKSFMEIRDVALDGYDPVAYFESGEAYMSDGTYHFNYKNTEWFFKSQEHLDRFKANPEAFMPAFSGFCAYELAYGYLVESDPRYWHIYNKKLYFFSSMDAKTAWYRDISFMISESTKAWKRMTP